MAYGTVPIAHRTGGLGDTVLDNASGAGTGFTFTVCDEGGLKYACGEALKCYRTGGEEWLRLQRRGMARDSSWAGAADAYLQLFEWAKIDPPFSG